jgi:hypothetical protein
MGGLFGRTCRMKNINHTQLYSNAVALEPVCRDTPTLEGDGSLGFIGHGGEVNVTSALLL